jgi:integrase/recombinase XerD
MTDTAMSPLRRRMIEDMTIRQFTPGTQHTYVRLVKQFSAFFGRSPDKAAFEDVRRYQLYLTSRGVSPFTINAATTALRFLFRVTLQRPDIADHTPLIPQPQKLPVILSPEEVARLLEAARGPKYKAALSVAYGAGLRVSEILSLKISDIDSKRMLIRVEQGKGRKDGYVMLSPHLLNLLRTWWLVLKPRGYLFPGRDHISPLTERQLRRACVEAAQTAGITKRVSPHTLRHSFATHLLERKVDIRVIQALLGHTKLDTTAIYTRVATKTIQEVTSPLEYLIRTPGDTTDAKAPKPTEQATPRHRTKRTKRTKQTRSKHRFKSTKYSKPRKRTTAGRRRSPSA